MVDPVLLVAYLCLVAGGGLLAWQHERRHGRRAWNLPVWGWMLMWALLFFLAAVPWVLATQDRDPPAGDPEP